MEVLDLIQNPVNVLRVDTGQLGQELLDEDVVPDRVDSCEK